MRKRSKYKPRPVIVDPLGYVLEGVKPIKQHESYLVDLKLTNHNAMTSLLRGEATKAHMNALIAMHNICEAIRRMIATKKITDLPIELDSSTLIRGKAALLDVSARGAINQRFVCRAPEIQAINDLMELHDELMDFISVKHMDAAIAFAKNEIVCHRATVINDYIEQGV